MFLRKILKGKKGIATFCVIAVAVVILAVNLFSTVNTHFIRQFNVDQVVELKDHWYYNNRNMVSFPFNSISEGEPFSISQKLDLPRTLDSPTLFFNTYYCDCDVKIDGKVVYSYRTSTLHNSKTDGCIMLLVDFKDIKIKDQMLTIEFFPQLEKIKSYKNSVTPLLGNKADIMAKLYRRTFIERLLNNFIYFLAIFFFVLFWVEKSFIKSDKQTCLNIGILLIFSGIYISSQSLWDVTITSYPYWNYSFELLITNLLVFPFLYILHEDVKNKVVKTIYQVVRWVVLACFFVQVFLQNFTSIDYREMLVFTIPVLILTWIASLIIVTEIVLQKDRDAFLKILPVCILVPVCLILYFVLSSYQATVAFEVGLLIFVIIRFRYLIKFYYARLTEIQHEGFVKRYEDIDILTGLENKVAFEKRLKSLWADKGKYSSIWCLNINIFDYRKAVLKNGKKGVSEILKAITIIIKSSVLDSAGFFKIGSDNFLILLTDYRIDEIIEVVDTINGLQVSLPVELVIGYSCYNPESDEDLTNMLNFAEEMTEEQQVK
ncbi:MAG: diguanylate cyclase [Sphaerochaetaceae bacterium]|nr:diguanylate cyclase [Sphaerochaetaceae bacterium]